jgi:hypothetical protein
MAQLSNITVEDAADILAFRVKLASYREKQALTAGQGALLGGGLGLGGSLLATSMSKKKDKQYLRNAILGSLMGAGMGGAGTALYNQVSKPGAQTLQDVMEENQAYVDANRPQSELSKLKDRIYQSLPGGGEDGSVDPSILPPDRVAKEKALGGNPSRYGGGGGGVTGLAENLAKDVNQHDDPLTTAGLAGTGAVAGSVVGNAATTPSTKTRLRAMSSGDLAKFDSPSAAHIKDFQDGKTKLKLTESIRTNLGDTNKFPKPAPKLKNRVARMGGGLAGGAAGYTAGAVGVDGMGDLVDAGISAGKDGIKALKDNETAQATANTAAGTLAGAGVGGAVGGGIGGAIQNSRAKTQYGKDMTSHALGMTTDEIRKLGPNAESGIQKMRDIMSHAPDAKINDGSVSGIPTTRDAQFVPREGLAPRVVPPKPITQEKDFVSAKKGIPGYDVKPTPDIPAVPPSVIPGAPAVPPSVTPGTPAAPPTAAGKLFNSTSIEPGAWVKSLDKNNFGQVISSTPSTATVRFTNPTTLATKDVSLPLNKLQFERPPRMGESSFANWAPANPGSPGTPDTVIPGKDAIPDKHVPGKDAVLGKPGIKSAPAMSTKTPLQVGMTPGRLEGTPSTSQKLPIPSPKPGQGHGWQIAPIPPELKAQYAKQNPYKPQYGAGAARGARIGAGVGGGLFGLGTALSSAGYFE